MIRSTLSTWKDLRFCVPGQCVIKTDWSFIDQDQINFWMRNTARLNDVFYGCLFRELPVDHCIAGPRLKEKIQVAVKAKPDRE
jgi:hypothetical protein